MPKLRRIYDNVGKRFCVKIRELRKGEEELLKDFLYEAILCHFSLQGIPGEGLWHKADAGHAGIVEI